MSKNKKNVVDNYKVMTIYKKRKREEEKVMEMETKQKDRCYLQQTKCVFGSLGK
jgi:hypothetical protein